MPEPDDVCELRIAVVKVEERMKVLESNIDRTLAEFRTDLARSETRASERNATTIRWLVLVGIGIVALVLGLPGLAEWLANS